MSRSAIEMMVDRACGIERDLAPISPEAKSVAVVDAETRALMSVGDAAKAWLIAKREGADTADATRVLTETTNELIRLGW